MGRYRGLKNLTNKLGGWGGREARGSRGDGRGFSNGWPWTVTFRLRSVKHSSVSLDDLLGFDFHSSWDTPEVILKGKNTRFFTFLHFDC